MYTILPRESELSLGPMTQLIPVLPISALAEGEHHVVRVANQEVLLCPREILKEERKLSLIWVVIIA